MTTKLRFIHCADLHIDSPFKGLEHLPDSLVKEVKQSTYRALDQLVKTAIDKQVEFILMVGDVFDQSIQSVYAQMKFLDACRRLNDHQIKVYISFGNHDYIQRGWTNLDFPTNVHLFTDENVTTFIYHKDDQPLATIYGFSYRNQAVFENKTSQFVKQTSTPYHIGMLHGSVEQNTDHDTYAPFKLNELADKGFDYWALGHIHQRRECRQSPPIVYSGNIQGRSKKETGEKGCYYVELDRKEVAMTFIPLQAIRFERVTLNVRSVTALSAVEQLLHETVKQLSFYGKTFVWIALEQYTNEVKHFYYEEMLVDLVDFINEAMMKTTNWVWIQQVELIGQGQLDKADYRQGEHFLAQLLQLSPGIDELDAALAPLWKHQEARKLLDQLTDEEKMELNEEAENILLYQLTRKHSE
ncbi:putative metallophosphoesterase YhaO [Paraliobacillus ryukyuensis]|uniref:DNA repair exonuclease SbcCD nuclease subunit n=1 Tax=Paraliobacillus ryukyuensis TaxID=200904 RepID=A0A366E943_9BACI|nr:DNA repair exonuclease [Paraliobacillus ryukyuensis]RBO98269.1 DNA repair exonuclease SbcCD nuclease subunit [Paraliobacillus ryukyuensis]